MPKYRVKFSTIENYKIVIDAASINMARLLVEREPEKYIKDAVYISGDFGYVNLVEYEEG